MLNFDILFGANCVSYQSIQSCEGYKFFAFILFLSKEPALSCSFLILLSLLVGFSLFKQSYYLFDAMIYLLILNMNTKAWTNLTAGDHLLVNICALSIFLRKQYTKPQNAWDEIKVLLHNVSFIALVLQVCLLYAYAALAKWNDADWISGNAVNLVNRTMHYSNMFVYSNANAIYPVSVFLTYLVLIYQTLFPVFVFIPRIKKYFLFLGVTIHLYISVVMGLFFFGLIMALTYVLFYDFESSANHKLFALKQA